MLCYTGPFPDKRELTLVNLADSQALRTVIRLDDTQVAYFVKHRNWSDQTKICFVAEESKDMLEDDVEDPEFEDKSGSNLPGKDRNKAEIYHCVLKCEKMFQKKLQNDMSYFSLDIELASNLLGSK